MKVALVNQPWDVVEPPVQRSSIAIWTYEVARRLAVDCQVVAYCRQHTGQPICQQHQGVEYRRVPMVLDCWGRRVFRRLKRLWGIRRPFFASSLNFLGYAWQVAQDVRARRSDVVHLHNMSQFVPVIRALNPQVGIVLHMHCEWLSQLDRAMIARRIGNCDLVCGCSDYVRDRVRRRFPRLAGRCRTLYNGVDTVRFLDGGPGRRESSDGLRRLLYVGRVTPEKGLHVLLDAFPEVLRRWPGAELHIVGPEAPTPMEYLVCLSDSAKVSDLARFYDGSYLGRLRSKLSPQAARQVRFIGPIDHQELAEQYRQADVVVNPSLSDSFPLTVLEAMASGLPVVATAVGGVPEAVQDGRTGLLVEPGSPAALVEAILRLLEDRELRADMGRFARRRAAEHFSWDRIAASARRSYAEVCPS